MSQYGGQAPLIAAAGNGLAGVGEILRAGEGRCQPNRQASLRGPRPISCPLMDRNEGMAALLRLRENAVVSEV